MFWKLNLSQHVLESPGDSGRESDINITQNVEPTKTPTFRHKSSLEKHLMSELSCLLHATVLFALPVSTAAVFSM